MKANEDTRPMAEFMHDRKAMLEGFDGEGGDKLVQDYIVKWSVSFPGQKDPEVLLAALHKARTATKGVSIEKRLQSKAWLTEHSMSSWDDGDLASGS